MKSKWTKAHFHNTYLFVLTTIPGPPHGYNCLFTIRYTLYDRSFKVISTSCKNMWPINSKSISTREILRLERFSLKNCNLNDADMKLKITEIPNHIYVELQLYSNSPTIKSTKYASTNKWTNEPTNKNGKLLNFPIFYFASLS